MLRFLKTFDGEAFDLIFIDPPFTKKMADETMHVLSQSKVFHQDTLIVIESTKHETIKEDYDKITCYRQKDYGDKKLSFFEFGE